MQAFKSLHIFVAFLLFFIVSFIFYFLYFCIFLVFLFTFFFNAASYTPYNPQKIWSIIKSPAPGIPRSPTITELIKFNPMWKSKDCPTKLITKIIKSPMQELNTSFKILRTGKRNLFPTTIIIPMQAIKYKTNLKFMSNHLFYNNMLDKTN